MFLLASHSSVGITQFSSGRSGHWQMPGGGHRDAETSGGGAFPHVPHGLWEGSAAREERVLAVLIQVPGGHGVRDLLYLSWEETLLPV